MKPLLLTNALIISEDMRYQADILIDKGRIQKIASFIPSRPEWLVIDVRGKFKLYQLSGDSWGQSTIIRCNESGEVPAASWDHNITVQENIRSPKSDIRILELQTLSSQYKIAVLC